MSIDLSIFEEHQYVYELMESADLIDSMFRDQELDVMQNSSNALEVVCGVSVLGSFRAF